MNNIKKTLYTHQLDAEFDLEEDGTSSPRAKGALILTLQFHRQSMVKGLLSSTPT